jgi:Polyketide cyclase / dehydrase and lipid transport
METMRKGSGRANALKSELVVRVDAAVGVPAEVVYDLLADVRAHLEWGGRMQKKKTYRLLSIEAPDGVASVGTEFSSTGADGMGTFADSSVVTEATRPSLFEFVTEARLSTKKGKVIEWTLVHRYEIAPNADGCTVSYTVRTVRISELPGPMAFFNVPGLRAMITSVARTNVRRGFRNLVNMAEERATAR